MPNGQFNIARQQVPVSPPPTPFGPFPLPTVAQVAAPAGFTMPGLGSFTLPVSAAPSGYTATGGKLWVPCDSNTGLVLVQYSGVSGSSFTGCVTGTNVDFHTAAAAVLPAWTVAISINRTGAGSFPWLTTLTAATSFQVQAQSSPDGTTWHDEGFAIWPGGPIVDKSGQVRTTSDLTVGPMRPDAASAQALVTVGGPSPVEISGTATLTA